MKCSKAQSIWELVWLTEGDLGAKIDK
jgi:hypothetical protein